MTDKRVEAVAKVQHAITWGERDAMSPDAHDIAEAERVLEAADAADDCVRVPRDLAWQLIHAAHGTSWATELRELFDGQA